MNRPAFRMTLLALSLSAASCLLTAAAATQKPPATFLKNAALYQDFRSTGAAPFHLVATFESRGPSEFNGKGTYEETWFSPEQWRREITLGSYHGLEIRNRRQTYLEQNNPYEPSRVLLLLITVIPTSLMESRYKPFRAKDWRVDDIPFEGKLFERVSSGSQNNPGSVLSVILNSDGAPVETQLGGIVTYYSSNRIFHGAHFPGEITIRSLAKETLLTVTLSKLEDPVADAATSLALPGPESQNADTLMPVEIGGPVKRPELLKYEVLDKSEQYKKIPPSEVTDRVAYGLVQIVVDKTGAAREPLVLYSPRAVAADTIFKVLSKWKFKPANLEGQPCEFLMSIAIDINGRPA